MKLAKLFKALSDNTRLRIIKILLNGSYTVNEILFIIGGNQSNISHHLKILYDSELVENKKEGSWIYYRLSLFFRNFLLTSFNHLIQQDKWYSTEFDDDKRKLEIILEKRKNNAEKYFSSLKDTEEKKFLAMLDKIFRPEEIGNIIDRHYHTIIDMGCGNGRLLPFLAKFCDQVIGVDSSERMLNLADHFAQKFHIHYCLERSDITSLPFENSYADAVFINMVLHHVPNPELAIKESSRIIQNNGKLFIVELLEHHDETLREFYGDLWLGFSQEELTLWLKNCGLEIEKFTIKEHSNYQIIILIAEKTGTPDLIN